MLTMNKKSHEINTAFLRFSAEISWRLEMSKIHGIQATYNFIVIM